MSEQTSPLHDPASALEAQTAAPRVAGPLRVSAPSLPKLSFGAITRDRARLLVVVALVAILVFAAVLRLTHIAWDDSVGPGTTTENLHPDERFLTGISADTKAPDDVFQYFDTDTSPLNPYNIPREGGGTQGTFVYGTLPLFVNKFVASHADAPFNIVEKVTFNHGEEVNDALSKLTGGRIGLPEKSLDNFDGYTFSGRWLSGIFELGTLLFIFLLGRQLANRAVGLLASLLYAFAAFPIQNAHYYIVDPYVTFFATACIYWAVKSAKYGGWHNFVLAGLMAGLAAACKITAVSLLPVAVLGVGVYAWGWIKPYVAPIWAGDKSEYALARDGRKLDSSILMLVVGSLLVLVSGFIAFRIAMPYAFNTPALGDWLSWRIGHFGPIPIVYPDIMNQHWIGDQVAQERLLSGDAAFPPNVQWIGRAKWLWPLQQMVSWGMGPALGITAWIGVVFAAVYAWRKREGAWLVPLAFVLGYFGFLGLQFSLYMRYFLPIYPTLVVLAAFVLYKTWQWASGKDPFAALGDRRDSVNAAVPVVTSLARAGVVVVVVFTALFGLAFYNMYRGPVTRAEASQWVYENVPAGSVIGHEHWDDEVPFGQPGVERREYGSVTFDNFNPDSFEHVEALLANIEAVDYIIPSSQRLSTTIPRAPAIWPVTTRYYEALESGELGFEKVAEFTSYPSIFGREFDDDGAEESYTVYDHPKVIVYKKTDAYSPEKAREVLGADAFVPGCTVLPGQAGQNCLLYRPDVAAAEVAGGTWSDIFGSDESVIDRFPLFFWLLVVELAALALAPMAIIVFRGLPDRGYLLTKPLGIFVLAYLAYLPASSGSIDFARGEIALALLVMLIAGGAAAFWWRHELREWVRDRWRFVLFAEALFLLAFLGSYWVRLQNPDLWHPFQGGEKPMDLAYFTAIIRSSDFSQGPIDPWNAGGYLNYYWYGWFIGATPTKLLGIVPEVAYNLVVPMFFAMSAAATFSLAYNLTEASRRLMRRRPGLLALRPSGPIIAGLFAVFLVMIAGNLQAVDVLHDQLARLEPGANGGNSPGTGAWYWDIPYAGAFIGGVWEIAFGDASFRNVAQGYDWWAPSRALTIVPGETNTVTPITEFPFWTFLFADLHAHLMAIPFSMTAAAVGFGAVLNFSRLNEGRRSDRNASREIASWAMVVLLGLIIGSLRWINSWDYPPFMLLGVAALLISERAKDGAFSIRTLAMGLAKSIVMAGLSYVLFFNVAGNYNQAYNGVIQADQTTDLSDFLSHFGVFLFLIAGFALIMLHRSLTRSRELRALYFSPRHAHLVMAGTIAFLPVALLIAAGIADAFLSTGWLPITIITFILMVVAAIVLVLVIPESIGRGSRILTPDKGSLSSIAAPVVIGLIVLGGYLISWGSDQRWGVTLVAFVGLAAVVMLIVREVRNSSPLAPIMLFVYAMVALGFGLVGGVEILTLKGDVGRMNTVFKFYLHVWMLWGVVSAYGLWYVFAVVRPHEALLRRAGEANAVVVRAPRYAFAAGAIILLLLTLVFPYFGTRGRINDRFDPSLGTGNDGLAFLEAQHITEACNPRCDGNFYVTLYEPLGTVGEHELSHTRDGINWIRQNIEGTPVVMEGDGPSYRSLAKRIAIYTGLPAVSGWQFHQEQQRVRFAGTVAQRHQDISQFYTTEDIGEAREILGRYDVGLVIVGDVEEYNYPPAGMAKFEDGLGGYLELLYENPSMQVWGVVPQDELESGTTAAAR